MSLSEWEGVQYPLQVGNIFAKKNLDDVLLDGIHQNTETSLFFSLLENICLGD